MARKPKALSLFAGCGGSDLALLQNSYNIVWANEKNDAACRTYEDNIGLEIMNEGDIRDFTSFPDCDLLIGCYPCQGFTQGGRRQSSDRINLLYQEFDRVLRATTPRAFVVENVNGMAYGGNRDLLQNQIVRYRLAGYRVNWSVLDARDFGVSQRRRRVFLVGVRSDETFRFSFPEPTHGPTGPRPYADQRTALSGMPEWPEGEFNDEPFHWWYMSRNPLVSGYK